MIQANPVWVFIPLLLPGWVTASEWVPAVEDGGVRVEQRNYPGSALLEIRGSTRIHASLSAVMALLKDAPFNRHWVYRSGGAKILQESGYQQAYVYGVVDAPWPMRDRDTIVRCDYRQQIDTAEITIEISNAPDYLPRKRELVRVPDFVCFWKLKPQGGGWVEVTYQVYGDPGGVIPAWLANYAALRSVTKTLQNMSGVVARYAGAHSPFVTEP